MNISSRLIDRDSVHIWLCCVRKVCLTSLILLLSTPALADIRVLQSVPLPKGAVSRSIAVDVIQHGHRMSIATLSQAGSIESVFEYLKNSWTEENANHPGYLETVDGDWQFISRIEDGWNMVVQMRPEGRSYEAFISVMELKPVEGWSYKPTMPRDGVLVSSTAGEEFGKATQTDIVMSKSRPGIVAGFYRKHHENAGWVIVSDKDINGSTVLMLQNEETQAEIVITPMQNGSVAVINKINK